MLPEAIERAAREWADRDAYVAAQGWSITYSELDRVSDEAAAGLGTRGLGEGSVVALALPSTIDYVASYLALAKIGAVCAGVNPRLTEVEQRDVIESIGATAVIAAVESAGVVPDDVETIEIEPAERSETVLSAVRGSGDSTPGIADDPARPVCICFTSGSTGAPKGAWYTNAQLRAIAALDTGGAWGGGGDMIASTQFAHVGFMTKLPWLLASGGTTRLLDRWSAGHVLELIDRFHMPAINAVPPQIALMLRHERFEDFDFDCVKAIVAGGGASSPALILEARERFGAPYSVRYSSTESGGVGLATALDADDDEALYTVGRPRRGVTAGVFDDEGDRSPIGEIGELRLSSPAVMSGYWGHPELTAEALVDGWLRTGDLARCDQRGLYTLTGRRTEMFIRGGYNVYPLEVEAALSNHPGVAEVAIIPRPDEVMGEIGVAVVVATDDRNRPSLDSLRAHAGDHLAHHKLPEALTFIDALPLNSLSKVDRRLLTADDADRDHAGGG